MTDEIDDLLPAPKPAPRGGRPHSVAVKLSLMACPIIEGCLARKPPTLKEMANLVGDRVTNSVATILGQGIGGENGAGGAGLWRDHTGAIRPIQENIVLMMRFASPTDREAMLKRRGETPQEFAAAVRALPCAAG